MTPLQHTRRLAKAFTRMRKAHTALLAAQAEVDTAFLAWAAGRRANRDDVENQLEELGYLERTRP